MTATVFSWPGTGSVPRSLVRVGLACACVFLILIFLARNPGVGQYMPTIPHRQQLPADSKQDADSYDSVDSSAEPAAPVEPVSPAEAAEASSMPVAEDKIIVMGRLESEDTDWVAENLPDWQHAIYTVDNTSAPLHTPQNKGREAHPYLLYIVQNYHDLPATIVFLHAHRDGWPGGWHTDVAGYDNVRSVNSLNLDFVQRNGYVNLRCNWIPGCPDEVQYLRGLDDFDPENAEHQLPEVWHHFFGFSSEVPEVIATPCYYQRYYQWLLETPKGDHVVGLIMEYMWHIIFGKDAVHCPDMMQCYRDVYGP